MALERFPRGEKKLNLLDKKREQKKKHKTQTKKGNNKSTKDTSLLNVVHCLRKQDIQEKMTILGRVDTVIKDEIFVSLPGGNYGSVTPFDLSRLYSDGITHKLLFDTSLNSTHLLQVQPISNLYNPGDYVVCYIKRKYCKDNILKISVSLDPQLINQKVPSSFLAEGVKIVCTIMSVQENGYVIDTGIVNVKAFLASENIDDGKSYLPGNQLFCVVKEIQTADHVSIVHLTAKKKTIDKVSTYDTMFLDSITPGTQLSLRIVKRIKNGFQVAFGENIIGYVHDLHLDKDISKYKNDMEVTGMLLYVLPIVKQAYFSLLITDCKKKFNYGDFINKAVVLQIREKEEILVRLPFSSDKPSVNHAFGLIPLFKSVFPFDKIPTIYAPGTTHKCRIRGYWWIEQLHLCSMEYYTFCLQSEAKAYSFRDFKIGDVVEVQVTDVKKNHVFVKTKFSRGFVPPEHNNGARQFIGGESIRVGVLSIDPWTSWVKFTMRLYSDLPILCDISQAKCGSIYHGTVVKVRKNCSIIRFYEDVKGYVPHSICPRCFDNRSQKIGKIVKVRVKSIDEKKKKMKLEFVSTGPQNNSVSIDLGQEVRGIIIRKQEFGDMDGMLTVQVYISNEIYITGFLPAGHMAPCIKLGYKIMREYKLGDIITAYVFNTVPTLLLSRAYKFKFDANRFSWLKENSFILCSVDDILESTVRVVLPVKQIYCKYAKLSKRDTSNFKLLHKHQLLYARIKTSDNQEKRVYLTQNLTEIWGTLDEDRKKDLLTTPLIAYLYATKELNMRFEQLGHPLARITLGQTVFGVIVSCDSDGVEIRLSDGVKAIAKKEHSYGNNRNGKLVNSVVLWKDDCLYVSLLPEVMNSISSKQDTLPALPLRITLIAEILMITEWFVLVLVKRNNSGYLACLPVRRNLNHFSPDLPCYKVHAKIRVYCVSNKNDFSMPVCMLESEYENLRATSETVSKSSCGPNSKSSKRKKLSNGNDVTRSKKMKKI
ncbi:protein RRP5 homolog isoform X2 [Pseudomyrmex gracilis]|uniref:protein RRP5 homolog isoform X2 n=1 Tax=Pseudomyrmex gracilis TaxID=219809 RepID=UPI000994D994|nr:protein RRP5 homolog isoform X2 [Pseudomyrmex gracilis]